MIWSLTGENLAKRDKTINYQQGKCIKIPFQMSWGNENKVPSVFTQSILLTQSPFLPLSAFKSYLSSSFFEIFSLSKSKSDCTWVEKPVETKQKVFVHCYEIVYQNLLFPSLPDKTNEMTWSLNKTQISLDICCSWHTFKVCIWSILT